MPDEGVEGEPPEPGVGPIRLIGRWLMMLIAIVMLLIAWPAWLGGPFGLTVVSGISMEPTYHTGDVVLTVKSYSGYDIGDVIVYTVEVEGTRGTVIHRVVAKNPDGTYITQGDNKKFADPWPVQPDMIRGRVLALIPQGLRVLSVLRSPLAWLPLFGILVAKALWPAREPKTPDEPELEQEGAGVGPDPSAGIGPESGEVTVEGPFHARGPGIPGAGPQAE
ncbi:MAG: signal peptidase I [Candidatus Nanopelagicales bacterium]|nr:signal peptidase I [Candidatus Nanopelagicales bacterium]